MFPPEHVRARRGTLRSDRRAWRDRINEVSVGSVFPSQTNVKRSGVCISRATVRRNRGVTVNENGFFNIAQGGAPIDSLEQVSLNRHGRDRHGHARLSLPRSRAWIAWTSF